MDPQTVDPNHGPFSPQMVSVYVGILTFLGLLLNTVKDMIKERRRREWEIEDRKFKAETVKQQADAKKASMTAAHQAVATRKELGGKIDESREERKSQMEEVKASVEANTVLTQETKVASQVALDAANNHNAKIVEVTEIAKEALKVAAKA